MELKFGRYKLRAFLRGDEPSIAENINDRQIERYTLNIPYPYTLKDARHWVDFNRKLASGGNKIQLNLAITLNGEVIGGIGLFAMNGHRAELGYWLGVKYWGRGIVTGAVKALTRYAFKELNLRRIYAKVFPVNKASARVLEKAGYKYEGRLVKDAVKHGRAVDGFLYAKTR
ncbi:MAG: GNAT family N-acetyltransferase [Elusimicrobiota bacterium]|nr:GNAT family N-acetyltransferase [Elusimicrobiota bacterium]